MDAPLAILFEMIRLVFSNTVGTLLNLVSLFGNLLGSLGAISAFGALGFLVAALVFGLVIFFLGRFFLGSWKLLAVLFIAGMVILWMLAMGAG